MTKKTSLKGFGFTLVELLIVIAIIAVIAAVAFVALDPATRFADSRDAVRWQDVVAVSDAIKLYEVDNGGASAFTIPNNEVWMVGDGTTGCDTGCATVASSTACVDLGVLVTDGYLAALPVNPGTGWSASTTGYTLEKKGKNITVAACDGENGTISANR